jgi:hypothetical protein
MSAIKSMIQAVEEKLMQGCSHSDLTWISVEMNLPLEFVDHVLFEMQASDDVEFFAKALENM